MFQLTELHIKHSSMPCPDSDRLTPRPNKKSYFTAVNGGVSNRKGILMKKVFSVGVLAAGLLVSGMAAAATDWSPVLCDVMRQCPKGSQGWTGWEYKKLPAAQKASVVKKTGQEDDGYAMDYKLFLKDATAFGFPLKRVDVSGGGGSNGFTLHFADNRFMSLKPKIDRLKKQDTSECGSIWEMNGSKNTLSYSTGC